MKKNIILSMLSAFLLITSVSAQNAAKAPASPAATSTGKSVNGAAITIKYAQPSVKGRTIGTDLEPLPGKIWRTGANEATTIQVDKDVQVEGKALAAGTYSLFTIANGDTWTIIFNKEPKQWGAYKYEESKDALRVDVKANKATEFAEKLTITASEDGKISILWGDNDVNFTVS